MTTPVDSLREKVARIIDPEAWTWHATYRWDHLTTQSPALAPSLAKADAILAALRGEGGEDGLVHAGMDGPGSTGMAETVKHMVDRFLSWNLPENFNPDDGISFTPMFNEHTAHPMRHRPTGTNLFDYAQAEAMVRHMIEGLEPR